MANTAKLDLPLIDPSQSQQIVVHNEALRMLDALWQLNVISLDYDSPPGTPAEGDTYIVKAPGYGAWAGKANNIVAYTDGAWIAFAPNEGWIAYDRNTEVQYVYKSSNWEPFSGGGGPVNATMVGVNTSADTTNRLAVKSDAVLLSHDDVTPGTGDMRITVNKSAVGKDAGFFFQDAFSTRATFGLLADDNFVLKTSPDGSTFKVVFTAGMTDGDFDLPQHAKFQAYANYDVYVGVASWTKIVFNATDHNDQNAFSAANNNFTAPQAGYYTFGAKFKYKINGANATALMRMKFYKNNTSINRTEVLFLNDWGGGDMHLNGTCMLKLAAGDVIDVRVFFETYDGYIEANTNLFWGCRIP